MKHTRKDLRDTTGEPHAFGYGFVLRCVSSGSSHGSSRLRCSPRLIPEFGARVWDLAVQPVANSLWSCIAP